MGERMSVMGQQEQFPTSSRRGFLNTLGVAVAAWAAASFYPVYKYLSPHPEPDPFEKEGKVKVDRIAPSDVHKPGMGKNGGYAGRGLIVLRDLDGDLKAFDSKCTHAGCNVGFADTKLYCNCHGGTYDFAGKNIAGPPPRPLKELDVFEEDGVLFVAKKAMHS
jgi:Rieske Fe-S protein